MVTSGWRPWIQNVCAKLCFTCVAVVVSVLVLKLSISLAWNVFWSWFQWLTSEALVSSGSCAIYLHLSNTCSSHRSTPPAVGRAGQLKPMLHCETFSWNLFKETSRCDCIVEHGSWNTLRCCTSRMLFHFSWNCFGKRLKVFFTKPTVLHDVISGEICIALQFHKELVSPCKIGLSAASWCISCVSFGAVSRHVGGNIWVGPPRPGADVLYQYAHGNVTGSITIVAAATITTTTTTIITTIIAKTITAATHKNNRCTSMTDPAASPCHSSVKIHDLGDFKDIYAIITVEDSGGKWGVPRGVPPPCIRRVSNYQ